MEEKPKVAEGLKIHCPQMGTKMCPRPDECDGIHRLCTLPEVCSGR